MIKLILLSFILIIIGAAVFTIWQYSIYKNQNDNISCGGDFSYNVQCPVGSFCQSLEQGPLAGGVCRAYFSPLFDSFIEQGPIILE